MNPIVDSYKHQGMRKALVEELKKKGIKDIEVLNAIGKVPRHIYFDQALEAHAYQDKAFPIGEGQTISQPFTVAMQSQLLEIKKGDKILEIGTGSGYQACVLAELGTKLFSIERNKVLFERTKKLFTQLPYRSIQLFCGDGSQGLPSYAPYNKIIVTAGAPTVPEELIKQLVVGGILVIPVGDNKSQKMIRIIKTSETDHISEEHGNFAFVPLIGKHGW